VSSPKLLCDFLVTVSRFKDEVKSGGRGRPPYTRITNFKGKVKGDGQECPSFTGLPRGLKPNPDACL
jgi:hypothetical protein